MTGRRKSSLDLPDPLEHPAAPRYDWWRMQPAVPGPGTGLHELVRHRGDLGMSDDNPSGADPFGQIADEFVEAFRQGKRPSVEEFARRYPAHADEIREMLPALALMERAKFADEAPGQGRPSAAAPLKQ